MASAGGSTVIDDHGLTASETSTSSGALRQRLVSLVWWAGAVLLGLIALSAVVHSAQILPDLWGARPDRAGLLWLGGVIAVLGVGLVVVGSVVTLARRGHEVAAVGIGLLSLVALRMIAIVAIPTPLRTDWAEYHGLAILLANGGDYQSARSPGWPLALSLLYRVGGPNPLLGELLNLAGAVGIGLLIYVAARRAFGPVAAAAGLALWAISPGPVIFTAVLASEPLFTLLFVAAVASAAFAIHRSWPSWILVGVLLGLGQYVRPVSLVVIPAFLVLPWLAGLPGRRAAVAGLAVLVAFAVVIGPSIAWQYQRYGRVVLSTSNYDGWNLLVGLNVAHDGRYNRDDLALVGAATNTLEFRDRSYQLAFDRLRANPGAVITLAAPKFGVMWGDNTYGVGWAMTPDPGRDRRLVAALALLSQVAYAVVVIMATACMWIRRRERDPVILITVLCLGSIALSEAFLEVQPRYHAAFEPLFCLMAGVTAAWLAERFWRRPRPLSTAETPGGDPSERPSTADGSPAFRAIPAKSPTTLGGV